MFINKKQISLKLNISASTIYRWSLNGIMPKPISIGPNKTVWLKEEIAKWIVELSNNSRGYGKPKFGMSDEKKKK